MIIINNNLKFIKAINKELKNIAIKEEKIERANSLKHKKRCQSTYAEIIANKIPKSLSNTLNNAFTKAFSIIFTKGIGVIEKGYNKKEISTDYAIQNYAIDKKGNRRELKKLRRNAQKSDLLNLSLTTIEGVGLGTLGIGLPDVVLFVGMILKGIYEVSLRYGYDYNSAYEKCFILSIMKAALSKGADWKAFNEEVDSMMHSSYVVVDDILKSKIEETSEVFATNMLVLKFIQGIPIIGVLGGVFNPHYYNKILNYARLKYHKRYLLDKLNMI